jgi:hypothetical protein
MEPRVIIEIPFEDRIWRVIFNQRDGSVVGAVATASPTTRAAMFRPHWNWKLELTSLTQELDPDDPHWLLRGAVRDYLRNAREFLTATGPLQRTYTREHS